MTLEQKSSSLRGKFESICYSYNNSMDAASLMNLSRQCAIICVEQIIMAVSDFDNELYSHEGVRLPNHREYYQNVLFHLKGS